MKGEYTQNKIKKLMDAQQYNTQYKTAKALREISRREHIEGYETFSIEDFRNLDHSEITKMFEPYIKSDYARVKADFIAMGYSDKQAVLEAKSYITHSYYGS